MNKVSEIDNERIAWIIRLRMENRRLKTTKLADYLGCNHSTVSGWVNYPDRRPIPQNRIERIAEALELDPRLLDAQTA